MENNQPNIQLEMNFNTPSGNRFRRCLDNGVFTVLFEHAAPGLELNDSEAARRLAELEKIVLASREVPAKKWRRSSGDRTMSAVRSIMLHCCRKKTATHTSFISPGANLQLLMFKV